MRAIFLDKDGTLVENVPYNIVGDIPHDIEAGQRAGCRTMLIDNSNETEWKTSGLRTPHLIAPDLYIAAQLIAAEDTTLTAALTKHGKAPEKDSASP